MDSYSRTISDEDCRPCDVDPCTAYRLPARYSVPLTYSIGRDRIPNANAAISCSEHNPDCDVYAGGERCSLYAHCLARGIDRGHQRGTGG